MSGDPPAPARAVALERLGRESLDLLVVGGGIVGAGVAALAAEHGLAVALLDRADFASATSSASSKLIHGGLRYLRMGDFRLVREALLEGQALLTTVAPHLVRRLPFVLPVYAGGPYGKTAIRSALWVYRTLAGERVGGSLVGGVEAASLVPSLRLDRLRAAGLYVDAQTNDARLCLANVRAAADRGAVVLNYAEVAALGRAPGGGHVAEVVDRAGGAVVQVRSRAVVNATGPWVDHLRRLEDPRAGTSVTLSKGAHLVLDRSGVWEAALTIPLDRSRVSFAIPWEGMLLLGTTDEPFEGTPESLGVAERDERQILEEAGWGLAADAIRPTAVRARFAGLRVLPAARRGTASARRETTIGIGPSGMVTVAGGKLTTYRRIAAGVLDVLRSQLGLHRLDAGPTPLPGAAEPEAVVAALARERPELDPAVVRALGDVYGSLAPEVLAGGDVLEPLAPGLPELAAQVRYAREREWAVTADDVLRRRTTLALRGHDGPELRQRIDALLRGDAPCP